MSVATSPQANRAFFGHPRGLGLLAFAESSDAFSYYGMLTLLVLYMTHELLLPGNAGHIIGFDAFHRWLEALFGSLPPVATATMVTGLFSGFAYVTPLLGALVADRWLGRTRAIAGGALLMTLGHLFMTFYSTFLMALLLLLFGRGLFSGNLKAQIADLYEAGDTRIADAFRIYLIVANVASTVSPLACGLLADWAGYGYGFAAAGLGMALGLLGYLAGRGWLPAEPLRRRTRSASTSALSRRDLRATALLLVLIVPIGLLLVANQQIGNAYLLWGEAHYRLVLGGMTIPVTWLIALATFNATAMLFLSAVFWRWYDRRFGALSELTRMLIGAVFLILSPLVLVIAAPFAGADGRIGLGWALGFDLVNEIGFATLWPTALALYARVAPRQIAGTMLAASALAWFVGTTIAGWIGGGVANMPWAAFWGMHAAIVGLGMVLLLLARFLAGDLLTPAAQSAEIQSTAGAAATDLPSSVLA